MRTASSSGCITSAHTAPPERAAPTKSWPSTRSPGSATYTSPGFASRESQVSPVASARGSSGSTMNEPPVHAAICLWFKRMLSILACGFVAERTRELLGGHDAIVEREHLVAHELIVLVALARDENRVARLRLRDGARDGGATVGLHFEAAGSRAHSAHDVLDDGLRIFGARVIRRHHRMVGRQGGLAHDGTLAGIAVAAAAEHADGAAGRERHDGRERLLQRVGRVGVVHEHRHAARVRRAHALQTTRDLRRLLERFDDGLGREAQLQPDAEGAHDVLHVELAHERVVERMQAAAHVERDGGVGRSILHVHGMDLRGRIEARRDHAVFGNRATPQQLFAPLVVNADHALGRIIFREQARLRLEVGLERMMVVQVILRQVGERRNGECGVPRAIEVERMRAHLHAYLQ